MPAENSAPFALSRRDCPAVFSGSGPSTGPDAGPGNEREAGATGAGRFQGSLLHRAVFHAHLGRERENDGTGTREITADRQIWQTAQPFRVGRICDYVCAGKS